MKSAALEAWMYRNPEDIADGLIARSEKKKRADERNAEIYRLTKSRRIKRLTKLAILGRLR